MTSSQRDDNLLIPFL